MHWTIFSVCFGCLFWFGLTFFFLYPASFYYSWQAPFLVWNFVQVWICQQLFDSELFIFEFSDVLFFCYILLFNVLEINIYTIHTNTHILCTTQHNQIHTTQHNKIHQHATHNYTFGSNRLWEDTHMDKTLRHAKPQNQDYTHPINR